MKLFIKLLNQDTTVATESLLTLKVYIVFNYKQAAV